MRNPLLTLPVHEQLCAARQAAARQVTATLDLGRTYATIATGPDAWSYGGQAYPYLRSCRDRTIYAWDGEAWHAVSRFGAGLIKLVPTSWGPPTFEIDGIKMLPTAQVSPYEDAARKVALVEPAGKRVLDCCGGLGYFAAWCLQGGAAAILSFEKNPDVCWLREMNPWSPGPDPRLTLERGDVAECIGALPAASFDAVLHDPPRFGIAGELYSQSFYDHLARVLRPNGRLFHYTGTPNKLTTGRDVPNEVARRLRKAGFRTQLAADGVLATRARHPGS
jgi:predicted methyltransferase